ncbi:ERF2 [Symbiodinium sp. CCMP2592]|nr:ERF2 [Symbiodinium sp. CCMP2592]
MEEGLPEQVGPALPTRAPGMERTSVETPELEAFPTPTLLTSKNLQAAAVEGEAHKLEIRQEVKSPSARTGSSDATNGASQFTFCGVDVTPALPVVLPTSTVLSSMITFFLLWKSHMVIMASIFAVLSLATHTFMGYSAIADPGQMEEDPAEGGELPPRAHRSWLYPRPILRHDHYCKWIHNVIGLRNHRAFMAMLVGMALLGMAGLLVDVWFLATFLVKGVQAQLILLLCLLHVGYSLIFLRLELQVLYIQLGLVSRNELNSEWKEDKFWTAPSGVSAKDLDVEEYNALLDNEALVYDASRNRFDKGLFNNCWAFWCRSRETGDW